MTESEKIAAKRYARALVDLSQETSQNLEGIIDDLKLLVGAINRSSELKAVLYSPAFTREEQGKVATELLSMLKLSAVFSNFTKVLVDSRRLPILPKIQESLEELNNELKGVEVCQVESAYEINAGTKSKLESFLTGKLKRESGKLQFEYHTNEKLIGGFRARLKDTIVDYNVKTALQDIKENLFTA